MATTVATPAASTSAAPSFSPGTSLGDALNSIPVAMPGSTPEPATPEPAAPSEPATPPPAESEPPAEGTEAPPVETPEEDLSLYDEIKPIREADGGKTLHFGKNQAKALLAARDFQQKLQEAVPNATVEDVAENFRRTVELDRMLTDHASGDPSRVDGVMGSFINPETPAQTLLAMADSVPMRLAQANPQAFQRLEGNILKNYIHNLYQQAQKTNNQRQMEIAQNLDFHLNGKFRDAQSVQQRDPLQDQRQQFDLERRTWQQERQQERQQWVSQQVQAVENDIDGAIQSEAGRHLSMRGADGKTIEDALKIIPGADQWKEFYTDRLSKVVDQAVSANPTWKTRLDTLKTQFRDNPSDKGVRDSLVTMMRQFAAPIIARKAKELIDARTSSFRTQNAAENDRLRQASERTEPMAGGTPVQRATAQQKLAQIKQKGGSLEEGFAALGF